MRTDHFNVILDILEKILSQINEEYINWSLFNADALNMTSAHWHRMMLMIQEDGLIKGYEYMNENGGYNTRNIRITLKGLCYLRENKR